MKNRDPWIGPLGSWELVGLARRGQASRARLIVLYLVFIAFFLLPILWFAHVHPVALFTGGSQTVPNAEMAAFADLFALGLLEAILLAVVAMTPAYAAASIAEEKEQRTLLLLLTTGLTDREIVMGKAAGRLGFVLAAAAAGFPILAATSLFGGVSIWFLLAGCAVIVATAVLTTAIGIHAGCYAAGMRGALINAYGMSAAFVMMLFPFGVLIWINAKQDDLLTLVLAGVAYPLGMLVLAACFFRFAVRHIRDSENVLGPSPPPIRRIVLEVRARVPGPFVEEAELAGGRFGRDNVSFKVLREYDRVNYFPPIDELDPILWKERYVNGATSRANAGGMMLRGLFGIVAVMTLFFGVNTILSRYTRNLDVADARYRAAFFGGTVDEGGRLLMSGGTLAMGLYLFPVAIGLAAAVARERQRQTLDDLRMLPLDRRNILSSKVRAILQRGWMWGVMAVVANTASFAVEAGLPLGMAAIAFTLASIGFVIGLGVWLTVTSPTEMRAFRFLVPAVVAACGVPVAIWNQTNWLSPRWAMTWLVAGAIVFSLAEIFTLWWGCRKFDAMG